MHQLKRDIRKAGIALAGLLLFFVFMVLIPMSVSAHKSVVGPNMQGTVQVTPTVDATMTALNKEQLALQVKQLENQSQNQNNWLVNNATALIAATATVIVAFFGISQWAINRRDERRKEVVAQDKELRAQAEERFKTAVTALGDEEQSVQIGGAILLRSFLHEDDKEVYRRYYVQIFDITVAYLRPSNTSRLSEYGYPDEVSPSSEDSYTPIPLTPLRQALIVVFKETFPLAREEALPSLDATGIQLDYAYLAGADLKRIQMPYSFIGKAEFAFAQLQEVHLRKSYLEKAQFVGAQLKRGNFTIANLKGANFNGAHLEEVNLGGAYLEGAYFQKAQLKGVQFGNANLNNANLTGADLSESNIEEAKSLEKADLRGAKGLTKKQLETCSAKGAIVDEDVTASPT